MCQINPMSEIRAIAETCRRKCLPANARLLWRVLFDCANDRQERNAATGAYSWPEGFFPVCNDELKTNSALEKRAILEARNVLKEIGAIDFIPGENNRRPAAYKIIYLTAGRYGKVPPQGTAKAPASRPEAFPAEDTAPVPIYKDIDIYPGKDEREYDEDEDDVDDISRAYAHEEDPDEGDPVTDRADRSDKIRRGFRYAFGRVPFPAETDRLVVNSWRMRMSPDMVTKALIKAAAAGATSPVSYALEVLSEWKRNEVRQPHQVSEYQVEYLCEEGLFGLSYSDSGQTGHEVREANTERRRRENEAAGII